MEKQKLKTPILIAIIAVAVLAVALAAILIVVFTQDPGMTIEKIPSGEEYVYVNPDETKAKTDEGMKIDGVLDEAVYGEKKWLHLSNDDGGNHVNIAMTSHFGEQGMYFVFDVTESVPIYVNLDRAPYMNSCIELYLAPPYIQGATDNSLFEIDLLPTGDLTFKKSNGKYGYENVATTDDIMACLGATTKGGEVNTAECYGYALELFIPWEYMQWLGVDTDAMKSGFVFINPAHITSNNLTGTNTDLDRYWYHYAQKIGVDFTNVTQYFRFDGNGIVGASEITLEAGEHYKFEGSGVAFPGMQVPITIIPDDGYVLTSILVDGQEQIQKVEFNEDGSVTLKVRCTGGEQKISAKAESTTDGKKTLSGKLNLGGLLGNSIEGVVVSYVGPLGEKPVTLDAQGNFELKDLDPGYYVLKVEKSGFVPTSKGVYLNRDMFVELTLKTSVFTVVKGTCWILDEENEGVLYKMKGNGELISNASYKDFTFETYLKYDPELAKLGSDDYHLQQRSGIRILFSNGKYWHINILRENDRYIMQYAKITGDSSIYSWKNVHTLTAEQIAQYSSAEGIKLTVERVGNQAAVYLDGKILFIEELPEEYKDLTAQLGFEAWISNTTLMKVPYSITGSAILPEAPKIYFYSANTWDVTSQDKGIVYKTGVAGVDTWLDAAITANDITTVARDLDPAANNYSMIYIFKFSNGEEFRVRLNHTDSDGKYRIQSMSGSTVFDAWKNRYTLTDEQAQKVQEGGIAFRVWIYGTTAYVYLDGQEVCTYDLSVVVATGQPSGIENAEVVVHLRMDGNIGKTVEVPFTLVQTDQFVEPEEPDDPVPYDPAKKINITIANLTNGQVTLSKSQYSLGQTVKLTVTPAAGYAQKLYINGEPLLLDWKTNSYSFVATESSYAITGSFVPALNLAPSDGNRWDTANQAHGTLTAYYPSNEGSWYMDILGDYSSITVNAKNYKPVTESYEGITDGGFRMVLRITLDNGKNYAFSIWVDAEKRYAYNHYGAGDSVTGWGGAWCLIGEKNADAAAALNGDGAQFKLERIDANHLQLTLNGTVLETYTMEGVTAANKVVSVGMDRYGNRGTKVELPFVVTQSEEKPPVVEPPVVEGAVQIRIPTLANGTVTTDKASYQLGDTVTLHVAPADGYVHQLTIDGEILLLDPTTGNYSFKAEKETYEIGGSFVPKTGWFWTADWNLINQGHGIVHAPANVGKEATGELVPEKGVYSGMYVLVKDASHGAQKDYAIVLKLAFTNGQKAEVRLIDRDDNGKYCLQTFGNNLFGNWSTLHWLTDEENAAVKDGDGIWFGINRTSDSIQLMIGNNVVAEISLSADVVLDQVKLQAYNFGYAVNIPMNLILVGEEPPVVEPPVVEPPVVEPPVDEGAVQIKIPTMENGTVTTDKASYQLGDTVTLIVTPVDGYVHQLTIDGEILLLDPTTGNYSFKVEKETYEIGGSFVPKSGWFWTADWNLINQGHNIAHAPGHASDQTGELVPTQGACSGVTVLVQDASHGVQRDYAIALKMHFANGQKAEIRLIDRDHNGKYCLQVLGNNILGNWATLHWLTDEENAAVKDGEGVWFGMVREGTQLRLLINGNVVKEFDLTAYGITADTVLNQVKLQAYNFNYPVDIPYEFKMD